MINQKEKAKQLLQKYKFKFLAKMYCDVWIWFIGSTYLKCVKQEIEKL